MRKFQWIAFGVLIGLVVGMAGSALTAAHAQMQGPSPAEAQAALDREKAILDQMKTQLTQMQTEMSSTMKMPMTATEKAMMKQISDLTKMVQMLWQSNTELTNALQMGIGSKNK